MGSHCTQGDDYVYTLDSKVAGDTTLEVKLLRGRNLHCFHEPGNTGFAVRVQVNGCDFVSNFMSGMSPVWDAQPFTFCVREDPWPLKIDVVLVGRGTSSQPEKECTMAVGELVLKSRTDLGEAFSKKVWVDLSAYTAPEDDEDDDGEQSMAHNERFMRTPSMRSGDRLSSVYLCISYQALDFEGCSPNT